MILGIAASDGAGNSSAVQNIKLEVRDIDDEAPVIPVGQIFSNIEAVINQPGGGFILAGPITDIDDVIGQVAANDNVGVASFAIDSGNDGGYFAIDATGRITPTVIGLTAASNDFESIPNDFILGISASDAAGNTSSGTVTIEVTNNPNDDSAGQTFVLTTSDDDDIPGSPGNDQILGNMELLSENFFGDTLQSGDTIDGDGVGDLDTLSFEIGAGNGRNSGQFGDILIIPMVSNVEVFDITSKGDGNILDMSRITGVTSVNSVLSTGSLSLNNVDNIINLGIDDPSSSDLTVNFLDQALSSSNDSLRLSLMDTENTVTINTSDVGILETLNVVAEGSTRDIILAGSALDLTHTLNISGSADMLLFMSEGLNGDADSADFAIVNASEATGDIGLDFINESAAITNDLTITGGSGNDSIIAGSGNDSINAGLGDDSIIAGSGNDVITGGSGSDTFNFATGHSGLALGEIDIVTDFVSGVDFLDFNGPPVAENFIIGSLVAGANYNDGLETINDLIAAGSDIGYAFIFNTLVGWVLVNNDDANPGIDLSIQLTGVTSLVPADIV